MRRSPGLAALTLLVGSVIGGTCAYPTERDASVHVSVTPVKILIRGSDTVATASAWQMVGPVDSQPIPNVAFVWSSSAPGVATVDNSGRIVGVNSGVALIRAAAANFDTGALIGEDTLRVTAPLEIDSVVPDTARYGQVVTVFGPGADKVVLASMKGAFFLYPYPFSAQHDTTGYGQQKFWIPPPAESDRVTFIGNGIVTASADSTHVIKRDVYEPNETAPHRFDLDGPRPFPYPGTAYNLLLVYNPALFFEPLKRGDTLGVDWYRFGHSTARDLTIILTAPAVHGTFSTFVTDSLAWTGTTYALGPDLPRHLGDRKSARRRLDKISLHQPRARHDGAGAAARIPGRAPGLPQRPRYLRREGPPAGRYARPGAGRRYDGWLGRRPEAFARHRGLLPGGRRLRGDGDDVRGLRRLRPAVATRDLQHPALAVATRHDPVRATPPT